MRLARLEEQVVEIALPVGLAPDLVAEVAGEGDAPDHRGGHAEVHVPDVHEPERLRRDVDAGERLKHLARGRPRDGEPAPAGPEGAELHRAVPRQVLVEPAQVVLLGGARARDEEAAPPEVREGEVADDLPVLLEHRRKHDAAFPRNPGGQDPVEPFRRPGPGD